MTPTPDQIRACELAIANVVGLLLPLDADALEATAVEHEAARDALPENDPARSFLVAGAAASRAIADARHALGRITPPAVTGLPTEPAA